MQAIILVGGKGVRLKPFTSYIPKPLLPIDDVPILEILLRQLEYFGFTNIVLSLNHLADLIMAFFQKGEKIGLDIRYSIEDKPLGTAGPLSIIDDIDDTFLVMNGDLLTNINYSDLMEFHKKNKNDATVSLFRKEIKIDLGVVISEDNVFLDYVEKPTYYLDVSMGVYVFNKSALNMLSRNVRIDIPELLLSLKRANMKIGCYRGDIEWFDIGRYEDYEKAVSFFREKRGVFIPYENDVNFRFK